MLLVPNKTGFKIKIQLQLVSEDLVLRLYCLAVVQELENGHCWYTNSLQ